MARLKPCPFCGQSVIGPIENRLFSTFHCRGCAAVFDIRGDAVKNWNTRADLGENEEA